MKHESPLKNAFYSSNLYSQGHCRLFQPVKSPNIENKDLQSYMLRVIRDIVRLT
jgi:hypothetical protein